MDRIGIIGTGVMGLTVARKLMDAACGVVAFDSDPKSTAKAREAGLEMVQRPVDVAGRVNIVLLFLPGPAQVAECVASEGGLLEGLRPGAVIADMSTVDPETTMRMAGQALANEVGYLDAPVLGRPATVGNWALPVGGREEDLALCRPVFEHIAARIFHVGASGTGHKIKLLNQMMFGAINAMTAEMMAVASGLGIPPGLLYETISASRAGTISNLFLELGGRIAKEEYEDATFTVDLLVKDLKLAVKMAEENHLPPILGKSVELINEIAQTQGLGSFDTSIMWKTYSKIWNLDPE
jgi:3-hydroxyisobutyrate dehydrogenase-like beta-hydroxyacid dehydrogenase